MGRTIKIFPICGLPIKICSKCKGECFLNHFNKNKSKKDGFQGWCKSCRKQQREENKDKRQIYNKNYYRKNKKKAQTYSKQYYKENREEIITNVRIYRQEHREERRVYSKQYYEENIEERRAYDKERNKKRLKEDLDYKLAINLRTRMRLALKGNYKSGSAIGDLGISILGFKEYMKSLFYSHSKTGIMMTFDNHGSGPGKWQIHHIKPLRSFDLTDREQFLEACHYTNLQPLWHEDHINGHWEEEE